MSDLIYKAYTEHKNLADSSRYLVNALFEEYGLLILDADDRRFKKQFSSIITDDIIQQNSFKNICEAKDNLTKVGIEAQVNPREINFFTCLMD